MNYFEFYQLPVQFHPDQEYIRQQYYALSKKYHPDFYVGQSAEKQEEVLERSTLNNNAFQVLKDEQKRLHYILELKNMLHDADNYQLPQSFLMEMMDINEAMMELEFNHDPVILENVKKQLAEMETSLSAELEALTNAYDKKSASDEETTLLPGIRDIYFRQKYLRRINERFF